MFVATDKNGEEWIYEKMPIKHISSGCWVCVNVVDCVKVPKGTIERLLNYPLTWDDDCQEIVEYKDKDLKEDKMIKQNIKMRVTPDQSRKIQEICFANGIYWIVSGKGIKYTDKLFLEIEETLSYAEDEHLFNTRHSKEIDADLFIRTNGTCEEESTLNDDDVARILKASKDQPIEYLMQKIVNLHDQLNKNRKTVQNQKEELTRLFLQKEELHNRWKVANRTIKELMDNGDDLVKQLEEKDAIIKYLESKLEI